MVWTLIALIWIASTGVAIDGILEKTAPTKPEVERRDERRGRWTTEELPDGSFETCYHPANASYETRCVIEDHNG